MAIKFTRILVKRRLIDAQEQAIINYITRNYQRSISLTLKHMKNVANYILQKEKKRITRVEKMWAKQFQKRYLELKRQQQRTLALERKDAFNIEELELYFAQLKYVCETFNIQISNR